MSIANYNKIPLTALCYFDILFPSFIPSFVIADYFLIIIALYGFIVEKLILLFFNARLSS